MTTMTRIRDKHWLVPPVRLPFSVPHLHLDENASHVCGWGMPSGLTAPMEDYGRLASGYAPLAVSSGPRPILPLVLNMLSRCRFCPPPPPLPLLLSSPTRFLPISLASPRSSSRSSTLSKGWPA